MFYNQRVFKENMFLKSQEDNNYNCNLNSICRIITKNFQPTAIVTDHRIIKHSLHFKKFKTAMDRIKTL